MKRLFLRFKPLMAGLRLSAVAQSDTTDNCIEIEGNTTTLIGGFVVWIGGGVSFTLAGEGIRVSHDGQSVCGRGDLVKVFIEEVTPGTYTVGKQVHMAYLKNSTPIGGVSDDTGHFRKGTTVCWGVDANNYFIRVQGKFLSEKEGREHEMSVRFSGKLMTSTTI